MGIAIVYTTFLRNDLANKTIASIYNNWNPDYVVLIGNQNKENNVLGSFILPYDCGLSYSRNWLVNKAKEFGCDYCLVTADSIEFTDRYDFTPIIDFMENNNVVKVGFGLNNRIPWEYNMELIPGQYFELNKPNTCPLNCNGVEYQQVDICKNFFLAKTQVLLDIPWDNDLKLCIVGKMPVILKDGWGRITVEPIKNLFPEHVKLQNTFSTFGKLQIWTKLGWKGIKHISRKINTKKILRLSSSEGYLECTEDHRLIVENKEIEAREFKKEEKLELLDYPNLSNKLNVDKYWAWLLGFFLAEGHYQQIVGGKIEWVNQDKRYLLRIEKTLNRLGLECEWQNNSLKKDKCHYLRIKSPKLLADYFREFYIGKEKTIPYYIYDFNKKSRLAFFAGFFAGDGNKTLKTPRIVSQKYPHIINGLIWLSKEFFNGYRINKRKNKFGEWFTLSFKNFYKNSVFRNQIEDIIIENNKDEFVYDITVEGNTFSCGIGNVNVHNCEHEDHCWRLKQAGYKTFVTNHISANYIDDKSSEYLKYRSRMYGEYRKLLLQKYNIKSWVKKN